MAPGNMIARGLVMRRSRDLAVPTALIPSDGKSAGSVLKSAVPNRKQRSPPGTSQGLFRDFHVCRREIPGTFRRVSREGPDSAERCERAVQGLSA